MKKATSISTVILVCLYMLLPIARLYAFLKGYEMALHGALAAAFVLAGLSLLVSVGLLIWQEKMTSKVDQILSASSALLFPLAFLHWAIFIPLCGWSIVCIVIAVLCLVLFAVLLFRNVQPAPMKIASGFVALLVSLPVSLWVLIAPVVGDFGLSDLVVEIGSPEGSYVAQVRHENMGMFGANTYVKVFYKKIDRELPLLSFNKTPTKITGDWGERKDSVEIEWLDDETLLINGRAYSVAEGAFEDEAGE